jgi:hypothetical protein
VRYCLVSVVSGIPGYVACMTGPLGDDQTEVPRFDDPHAMYFFAHELLLH